VRELQQRPGPRALGEYASPLPTHTGGAVGASISGIGGAGDAGASVATAMAEVRRLMKEKSELLRTGLYSHDDAVINQVSAL